MKVPQGVEKVVALATLSTEWRAKVLADALAAAGEAGIELGESERGVLGAISPRMLAGMIDSFGKSVPRPAGLGRLAAGAAVVALLSGSLLGCGEAATDGHRPNVPPPNPRKEDPPPPATKGIRPDIPPEKDAPKSAEPKPAPPAPAPGE
jgi:hypothetical protein